MRLLTHNLLMCNKADCSGGFPLRIELASEEELEKRRVHIQEYENAAPKSAADLDSSVSKVAELKNHEILPAEMNPVFVRNMLGKIEWPILAEAANQLNLELPNCYQESDLENEQFLQSVHRAINEFHVLEGFLICPKCQHRFVIRDGIPDMVVGTD
eukprot:Gregarina_sp_Poly_1__2049@NODE_1539_length_3897_cov_46_140992_g996_i1_p2_GENE_NODE_1539_length_3897_cov_46_140992_g996_i1NODE_1539_length_3897_cov_46_140992_g996_i1_p2_ORF_typecomplete_len157_score32_73Trm112p/PF03966_16/2_7e19Ntox1/PF15500_6/0_21_NODE_1539_length_3897_cov_46_140992_g996_i1215685